MCNHTLFVVGLHLNDVFVSVCESINQGLLEASWKKGVFFMSTINENPSLQQTYQPTGATKHRGNSTEMTTKTMVTLAMLTGLAYMVMWLSKLLPEVNGFLEFDFKDMVITIGGFLYGPVASGLMVIAVSVLQFFTASNSGPIGLLMNVIATGSFCCTASLIYWYRPNFKGAVMGLTTAGLLMTGLMLLWNYAITPLYMGIPREAVVEMLVPIFLPFNLVKAGLNMGAILVVYPKVMSALTKANLAVDPEEMREQSKGKALCVAVSILVVFVVCALMLTGII